MHTSAVNYFFTSTSIFSSQINKIQYTTLATNLFFIYASKFSSELGKMYPFHRIQNLSQNHVSNWHFSSKHIFQLCKQIFISIWQDVSIPQNIKIHLQNMKSTDIHLSQ